MVGNRGIRAEVEATSAQSAKMTDRSRSSSLSGEEQEWSDRTSNDEDEASDYEVERILLDAEFDGATFYLVKWKGYADYR